MVRCQGTFEIEDARTKKIEYITHMTWPVMFFT